MNFHVADSVKPFGSAAAVVKAGGRIIMDTCGSFIENKHTGQKIKLRVVGGTFVFDVAANGADQGEFIGCVDDGRGSAAVPAEDDRTDTDEEHGRRESLRVLSPARPGVEEVREHELTHLPFRNWCDHCVRGRGEERPHRRVRDDPVQHEVHLDFCFPGDEFGEKGLTILVARERLTKMMMGTVVPRKSTGQFIARRVCAFLREVGVDKGDITVKTDQEPALLAAVDEIARHRAAGGGGRTVQEQSPVYDSKGNGFIERAVKSLVAQVRVGRSALEARIGATLEHSHAVLTWLVEYSAFLLNRFEVSKDGLTAYERCKGKKARVLGVEFGELVHWRRRPVGGHMAKLTCLWGSGVYIGVKGSTGEVIVPRRRVADEDDQEAAGAGSVARV